MSQKLHLLVDHLGAIILQRVGVLPLIVVRLAVPMRQMLEGHIIQKSLIVQHNMDIRLAVDMVHLQDHTLAQGCIQMKIILVGKLHLT